MSSQAKRYVQDQLLTVSDFSAGSSYEIDFEGFARENPSEFKKSFLDSCSKVPLLIEARATGSDNPYPGDMILHTTEENN